MLSRSNFPRSKTKRNGSLSSVESRCSTCDSDSESDDIKWPWVHEIQANGDLIYIENQLLYNTIIEEPDISQSILFNTSKDQSLPQKIRHVIKHTPSFAKKSIIKDENKENSNRIRRKSIHVHPTFSKSKNNFEVVDTKVSRKNILVYLPPKLAAAFVDLENLFGLISGLENDQLNGNEITLNDYVGSKGSKSILVQGIVPSNQASFSEDVLVGDLLVAVNGCEVDHNNISKKLAEVNGLSEVVLTFERCVPHFYRAKSMLLSLVSNTFEDNMLCMPDELCAIMVLTLGATEDKPDSDILFFYPKNKENDLLHSIRGMFLTLDDVVADFIGDAVQSSTLLVNSRLVNVGYKKVEGNLFVVAIPNDRCSMTRLLKTVKEFTRLLILTKVQFLSLESNQKHLVVLLMETLLNNSETEISFGSVRQLQLSVEYYADIGCVLNDLEAADYGECIDDFFPHRRLYCFLGTALFYKDNLICNHLHADHLKEIILLCKYHGLFLLLSKERVNKIIFWKEIFLSEDSKLSYEQPASLRWFVLVVGQGHALLAILLEAGSIASLPGGNPGPHPYYVDAAFSILSYILETMNLESLCEQRLNGKSFPAIVNPSNIPMENSREIELRKPKIPPFTENSLIESRMYRMYLEDEQSSVAGSSTLSSESKTLGSFSDVSNASTVSTKLTCGPSNMLFQHITFKRKSAIYISSNMNDAVEPLSLDVLNSFLLCCEEIHKSFAENGRKVVERGVMFNALSTKGAAMKKGSPNILYWVIGRLVKRGKDNDEEIFVCFQDGVPQNTVEMVFKMRFGSYY